ncbi:HD domain-containing phosphohydrolase [Actinomycetota bacterium]
MSILKRGIIIFSSIIVFAILITFSISYFIIDRGFLELEQENTSRILMQTEYNLLDQRREFSAINGDLASSDDTYNFIEEKNNTYIESNLSDESISELNIDFMMFLNQAEELVYDKAIEYEYNRFTGNLLSEKTGLSEELSDFINDYKILINHNNQESGISGLIILDDKPVLVSSRPILKSNRGGPPRGLLIIGRFLDDEEIESFASITYSTISLITIGEPGLPEEILESINSENTYEIIIIPESENTVSGYRVLNDIEGNHSFVLEVRLPRDIYNKGRITELLIILIVSGIILVFGLLIFFAVYRFGIKRLGNLNAEVKNIGEEKDFTRRIDTRGEDELSTLSTSINSMLDELNDVQNSLKRSEGRYRSLFENSLDGIYISTKDGKYIDANPSLVRMLDYASREELLSVNIPEKVYYSSGERPSREDRNRVFETSLKRKDGTRIFVEISSRVICDSEGNSFYQGIVRDITLRRNAEERIRLLSFHDELTGLYNRAYFEEELIRLNTKRQLPLSIIMGDVNGLKLVNDAFGHKHGDELLIKCARIFEECSRKDDIVARWGGDEFIILLPKTPIENALKIIERVNERCKISKLNGIPISISLGAAAKISDLQEIEKVIKEAEDMMYKNKLIERKTITNMIVASLEKTLWEKSGETSEHAARVREISRRLGKEAGLDKSDLADLELLAVIHDVGKIAVPDEILSKSGELTQKEWEVIKRHPEVGFSIAQSTTQLAPIAEAILSHHERWDGKGYPQGLAGKEIPLISRIVAVVDAFDVMTNGTPYREPLDREDAFKRIEAGAGTLYDPELVKKFAGLIDNYIEII